MEAVNYYHKVLHRGCCRSPRSASEHKHIYKEAVVRRSSVKKVFLKTAQNSRENTCAGVSFLIKLFKKETLAQVFSCEFCAISKITFYYRTPLVAASVYTEIFHLHWVPLKVQSCKLCNIKDMIASTQITHWNFRIHSCFSF